MLEGAATLAEGHWRLCEAGQAGRGPRAREGALGAWPSGWRGVATFELNGVLLLSRGEGGERGFKVIEMVLKLLCCQLRVWAWTQRTEEPYGLGH